MRRLRFVGSSADVDRRGLRPVAVRLNARRGIDGIFQSSRRSLELRILLNRQRPMEDIAGNDSGAI
jgi:hypothetical protein